MAMSTEQRKIEVIWKGYRPTIKRHVERLLGAHWKTALDSENGVPPETILIRSGNHITSALALERRQGKISSHPPGREKDPHVTTSYKRKKKDHTHCTSHGYTASLDDFTIISVTRTDNISSNTTNGGRLTWPIMPLDPNEYEMDIYTEAYLNGLINIHPGNAPAEWPSL